MVPQTIDFIPHMDGGVFSCDVKLMKPDQRIYQAIQFESYEKIQVSVRLAKGALTPTS